MTFREIMQQGVAYKWRAHGKLPIQTAITSEEAKDILKFLKCAWRLCFKMKYQFSCGGNMILQDKYPDKERMPREYLIKRLD